MYWTRWCRWFATSQLLRASHSFGVREQLKQQGAKSVNRPSFVCCLKAIFRDFVNFCYLVRAFLKG
jgi:hypothetical protein